MKDKEVHKLKGKYVVFAEEPDLHIQESLVQQSNTFDDIEKARSFASRHKGTCYIFKQVEQHYVRHEN